MGPISSNKKKKPLSMTNVNNAISGSTSTGSSDNIKRSNNSKHSRDGNSSVSENSNVSSLSSKSKLNEPGRDHLHAHGHGLQPIQTSNLDIPEPIKTTRSRTRTRSISPHARALLRRTFSRSRSRSRSSSRRTSDEDDDSSVASSTSSSSSRSNRPGKQMLVAVTSCKSDAYYAQKAPGAISMLPRKAPSALKTFHELAVGMKDAYEAVGATPVKVDPNSQEFHALPKRDQEGKTVLFAFMENINFLLALVDEVATDSATRGALKDDAAFKSLRDVIKKCNKVLERMLVRRENKYTLFYRLVQPHDAKDIEKMKVWNGRVDKAINSLSKNENKNQAAQGDNSDAGSVSSAVSGSGSGIFRRGRGSSAGRTRSRRATPTPRLRNRFRKESSNSGSSTSADDGYATVTADNVAKLQQALPGDENSSLRMPKQFQKQKPGEPKANIAPMAPKDELVGMIQDLRSESKGNDAGGGKPENLKPNWMPKADVPGAVPKLPIEYIHRHRLMKQVVNSLINRPGAVNREDVEDKNFTHIITSITSRHADKAGNGKTTLAAAAIQSVEVRERFGDGIAWIQLGRAPLSDNDIRRLYEELYDQLLMRDIDFKSVLSNDDAQDPPDVLNSNSSDDQIDSNGNAIISSALLKTRRKFQASDLEGMKEDLGRILSTKNVLICLDDVWRVEDAKRFIFDKYDNSNSGISVETCPYRILVTTRTPGLLGDECANEVFVRIFSEQEAVKLLISSAGRRLYGGKTSPVFNEARVIVKGCGNSPLALRLAGGMLRTSNRNWTLSSRTWLTLVEQCKASLEEASKIRSFVNSVGRVVDLSFVTVEDLCLRASLRRCFVTFAMVFHNNDLLLTGRGIPRGVVRKLFFYVISGMEFESNTDVVSPDTVLDMLERMNLLHRAGHDAHINASTPQGSNSSAQKSKIAAVGSMDDIPDDEKLIDSDSQDTVICHKLSYLMHESIKHIASEMATRGSPTFAPKADSFTSFRFELDAESEREEKTQSSTWFSSAAKYLFSSKSGNKNSTTSGTQQFHELMACALMCEDEESAGDSSLFDGENVEKYIVAHLPSHYINARMFTKASNLLLDRDFINRRIDSLGCLEATRRHMLDLVELRRDHHRSNGYSKGGANSSNVEDATSKPGEFNDSQTSQHDTIDAGKAVREGSRRIIDAVKSAEAKLSKSGKTIDLAVCLSAVGEGLLKGRQTKESIIRLEEAVYMFSGLLGSNHVEVARCLYTVARAYVKTGDEMTALSKLSEATRIYELCNATPNYDSIVIAELMATLMVNSGDWERAAIKYDEVLALKGSLYGPASIPVAKSMNDYAIVLAKHNRMSEALRQYEAARSVFQQLSSPHENESAKENVGIFAFDITLIDLNIASIKSKLANYQGALESYERGVQGLRIHIEKEKSGLKPVDATRQAAQKRHLVSAIGRIGSLRMKLRDNAGALQAYLMLIEEVDDLSPLASQMEKGKAHVKCATIYRQIGSVEDNSRAVTHLEEALAMYSNLHGSSHKDTKAIASSLKQWKKADKI